jgi:hypothetical protein
MKFDIIQYFTGNLENDLADSFLKNFHSVKIPTHNAWKKKPKVVIQELLNLQLQYVCRHSGLSNIPETIQKTLPNRVVKTLERAQFGYDEHGKRFVAIANFNHSNGCEKLLSSLHLLHIQNHVDYVVIFCASPELKSITDGIMSNKDIAICMTEYKNLFSQPTFVVSINPLEFFDLRSYRDAKDFWKQYTKSADTFDKLITEHPSVKHSLGIM